MPLLGEDEKLGRTVIDAILKEYQEVSETEGRSHWAVLSSWLGPLVEGRVIEGRHVQSCEEYKRQAVSDVSSFRDAKTKDPVSLLARTLWVLPLCSTKEPKHWVTTWIDWSSSKIGIFNSIPEYGSSSWVEPVGGNYHLGAALVSFIDVPTKLTAVASESR